MSSTTEKTGRRLVDRNGNRFAVGDLVSYTANGAITGLFEIKLLNYTDNDITSVGIRKDGFNGHSLNGILEDNSGLYVDTDDIRVIVAYRPDEARPEPPLTATPKSLNNNKNKVLIDIINNNTTHLKSGELKVAVNIGDAKVYVGYIFGDKFIQINPTFTEDANLVSNIEFSIIPSSKLTDISKYSRYMEYSEAHILGFLNGYTKVFVKSYIESAERFGYKIVKKNMVGKQFKVSRVFEDEGRVHVSVLNHEIGKSLKFFLSDLNIQYPDVNQFLKGYNLPKDRTIKPGSIVKVVSDKSKVKKGSILTVNSIGTNFKISRGGGRELRRRVDGGTIELVSTDKNNKQLYNPNCKIVCVNESDKKSVTLRLREIRTV